MIGATLHLPTIDKMIFRVRPEFCDVTRSALKKCIERSYRAPGLNKQIFHDFNDSETGVHYSWSKCEGLRIDCNPNNIGDPDDIMKIYKSVGVGLPDPYVWELNRIDIERNQQLSRSADAYIPILDSSLGPKMRRTDPKPYPTTYTTGSRESTQMQFYDKTAERKARGKAIATNNVMRLEFRFMKARVIKKLGIQTAGDLYGRGTDFLTTVYKQQFDRFLPGLPSFAGDGATWLHGSKMNKLAKIIEAIDNDPDRKKMLIEQLLYTLSIETFETGVGYTIQEIEQMICVHFDSTGKDRRIKSKNLSRLKELRLLPTKYGTGEPTQLNRLAKELLSFAS